MTATIMDLLDVIAYNSVSYVLSQFTLPGLLLQLNNCYMPTVL